MLSTLIFTEKVVNLRAWQLYLGNGIWTLLVGLVLMILGKLFGMAGINSGDLHNILSKAGAVATNRDSQLLSKESYQNYQ